MSWPPSATWSRPPPAASAVVMTCCAAALGRLWDCWSKLTVAKATVPFPLIWPAPAALNGLATARTWGRAATCPSSPCAPALAARAPSGPDGDRRSDLADALRGFGDMDWPGPDGLAWASGHPGRARRLPGLCHLGGHVVPGGAGLRGLGAGQVRALDPDGGDRDDEGDQHDPCRYLEPAGEARRQPPG